MNRLTAVRLAYGVVLVAAPGLVVHGPRRRAGLTEALLACSFAAAGIAAARRPGPGEAVPGGQETEIAARLARWRQHAAERAAILAVPAAVRRWAAQGKR